jgi:hypothetical protein
MVAALTSIRLLRSVFRQRRLNRVLHPCANVPVRFLVARLRIWLGRWGRRVDGWCGGAEGGDLRVEGLMAWGGAGVGKIWVALVALAVELIALVWLVGVHVWEWAGAAIAQW